MKSCQPIGAASKAFTWNPQYGKHSQAYVASKYRYDDRDGRGPYRLDNMTSPNPRPNMMYEWKGHASPKYGWRYSRETMQKLDEEGRIWYPASKDKRPYLKRYLNEMSGRILDNIWVDISPINSQAAERLGYPTQKPEALLERIIQASSNRGDVVLDPFCGCGTTIAVAERLNRQWIGIDISPTAVNIMKARVQKLGGREHPTEVRVYGMPTGEAELRELRPFEFQNWVIQRVDGTHSPKKTGDMGIDGFSFLEHAPIQVKRSDRVGRNVVDNFETAVERHGAKSGYIVAFSFTRGAHEEVARAKAAKGLELELVTVKDLLLGTSELVAPVLNRSVVDLPLPPARPKGARPTAEQLVESDQRSTEVA